MTLYLALHLDAIQDYTLKLLTAQAILAGGGFSRESY